MRHCGRFMSKVGERSLLRRCSKCETVLIADNWKKLWKQFRAKRRD